MVRLSWSVLHSNCSTSTVGSLNSYTSYAENAIIITELTLIFQFLKDFRILDLIYSILINLLTMKINSQTRILWKNSSRSPGCLFFFFTKGSLVLLLLYYTQCILQQNGKCIRSDLIFIYSFSVHSYRSMRNRNNWYVEYPR